MITTKSLQRISLLIVSMFFIVGCGGLGKMEKYIEELNAQASPDPLIVQGDSVEITITGKFPEKYFHKKVIAEATPVLVYTGGETAYETQGYRGEDAASNYEMIPYDSGKSFSYTDKIPYDPAMQTSNLELRISGSKGSQTATFDPLPVAQGVITTPYLMESDDKVIMAKDNFQRTLSKSMEAIVNYDYNSSSLRSKELRDEDVKAAMAFIQEAAVSDSLVITGTNVEAYASPEGEITLNEDLAQERAESANSIISKEMKKRKISPENAESFFKNSPKGEDWEGFKELMMASEIEDKNTILRVLEMYSDKNQREQEIKNISKTYREIEKDILPSLRRSQITINYNVEGYTDEELKVLSKSNPDILTIEELLYAATLESDMNGKLDIYKHAERIYPNDQRGINNVGYILMMQNKMNEAKDKFEKALAVESNPVTLNNLGVIARLEGDRDKAMDLFDQAMSAGSEVKYNKALVQIQNGDYSSAISNMSGTNSFNVALAKVLNGDVTGAESAMSNSGDDTATGYYLRAIIAARNNSSADVISNLTTAISKDGSLKEKAMNDLEFRDYKSQFTF